MPSLDFFRGWCLIIGVFLLYCILFNLSSGYQPPWVEFLTMMLLAAILSWRCHIDVSSTALKIRYRHLFLPIGFQRNEVVIQSNQTLSLHDEKFGYESLILNDDKAQTMERIALVGHRVF